MNHGDTAQRCHPRALRIALLTDRLVVGGAERHAIALANSLPRDGFEVSVLPLRSGGFLERSLEPTLVKNLTPIDVTRRLDLEAVRRAARLFRARQFDVVICVNPYPTLYAVLASLRLGRGRPRIVSIFHSTSLPGFKNQLQMFFYRFVFLACDALVYVSENQRRYWRKRGLTARKTFTIQNGIDFEYFSAAPNSEESERLRQALGFSREDFVVGVCAALRPEKAHTDLLRVVAGLRSEGLNIKCLFVGDGPERERIEALVTELGLKGAVQITGFVLDVRPFVAACDVMALPSHSVETFSVSALESMAMKRPLVMTNIGGASEQVVDGVTGHLYEKGDLPALSSKLRGLAEPGAARALGERAFRYVTERFTLEHMVSRYTAVLRSLVGRDA